MAQETLNIVITADNKDAINNINQTIQSTNTLGESLKKMPDVTGKAALALNNLSRIAQDAPYGFMGISNNINPMLESFQRLQKETGSTGSALKSMVSMLSGPAGIGLAVGVASSLIVKFGDNIAEFFSKLGTGNIKIIQLSEELKKTSDFLRNIDEERNKTTDSVAKEATGVEILVAQYSKNNTTLAEREGIITKLKSISPEYFGGLSKENTSIQQLNTSYSQYISNLQTVITARLLEAELSQRIADRLKYEKDAGIGLLKTGYRNPEYLKEQNEALKKWQLMMDAEAQMAKEIANLSPKSIGTAAVAKKKEPFDYLTAIKKGAAGAGDMANTEFKDTAIEDAEKEHQRYLVWLGKWTQDKQKLTKKNYEDEQKLLKAQEDSYKSFAKTLSSEVTGGIMNMWEAMQHGENPLKALADMFLNIAKSIAAAIIEATIFEALMNAFPELKGAFAAIGLIAKVPKHADGGITTGASIGMIGEAGPEAIMPLSKLGNFLNTTFNAGAMSGNHTGGNATFTLRGQDLLVALNRTQKSSNLKGQTISLA